MLRAVITGPSPEFSFCTWKPAQPKFGLVGPPLVTYKLSLFAYKLYHVPLLTMKLRTLDCHPLTSVVFYVWL